MLSPTYRHGSLRSHRLRAPVAPRHAVVWRRSSACAERHRRRSHLQRRSRPHLVAIRPRNKQYNLSFGLFRIFPGQTWPRDPLQGVRLEKWCRTHLKLAPETNSKAMSWQFPGLGQKTEIQNDGMTASNNEDPPTTAVATPSNRKPFMWAAAVEHLKQHMKTTLSGTSIQIKIKPVNLVFAVWAGFRQNLAPGCAPAGQARQMV